MVETQTTGLGYDQVLLVPAESHVLPNTVSLKTKISANFTLNIPMIAEATGTESDERVAPMAQLGGLGVIAAAATVAEEVAVLTKVKQTSVETEKFPQALVDQQGRLMAGVEVWLAEQAATEERVAELVKAGADAIFFYLKQAVDAEAIATIKAVRASHPALLIVVGVVEDAAVAAALYQAGADSVLAGRAVDSNLPNNNTFPFLTVTMAIATAAAEFGGTVLAVGGINYSGDIVKAIAGGANAIMANQILQGEVLAADGSTSAVPMTVADAVFQALGGLRSGMGYTGAGSVDELIEKGQFVQISDNGLQESHPHDVQITKQAPNFHEREGVNNYTFFEG